MAKGRRVPMNQFLSDAEVAQLDPRDIQEAVCIRATEYTQVFVIDDSADDPANATHDYCVLRTGANVNDEDRFLATINFQRGPIKENGVNGVQNEDLIATVIDRLQHFQKGPFACRENAIALTKLEEALLWLDKRTADRKDRNVEGTNQK